MHHKVTVAYNGNAPPVRHLKVAYTLGSWLNRRRRCHTARYHAVSVMLQHDVLVQRPTPGVH